MYSTPVRLRLGPECPNRGPTWRVRRSPAPAWSLGALATCNIAPVDVNSASRPEPLIASSRFTRRRIQRCLGAPVCQVLPSPGNVERFRGICQREELLPLDRAGWCPTARLNTWLVHGVSTASGLPLIVVGEGPGDGDLRPWLAHVTFLPSLHPSR